MVSGGQNERQKIKREKDRVCKCYNLMPKHLLAAAVQFCLFSVGFLVMFSNSKIFLQNWFYLLLFELFFIFHFWLCSFRPFFPTQSSLFAFGLPNFKFVNDANALRSFFYSLNAFFSFNTIREKKREFFFRHFIIIANDNTNENYMKISLNSF